MIKFLIPNPDGFFSSLKWRAKWAGRQDGRDGIPGMEDPLFSPFEMSIKQKIDYSVQGIATDWHKLDGPLFEKYCRLKKGIQILRARKDELVGELDASKEERRDAEAAWMNALKQVRLGKIPYALIMGGLAIGEFPLNSQVFAILGERTELTYLFAATLALGLPVAAHLLGLFIHRHPFQKGGSISERIMTIGMIVAPLAVISGVAFMREKFIESSGVTKTLGISMDPSTVTWIFLAFNLMIFLVALAAAYFAHDPGYVVDTKRHGDQSKGFSSRNAELIAVRTKLEDKEKELAELSAKRQQTFNQFDYEARSIKDYLQIIMEVYRAENLRERAKAGERSGKRPLSFRDYPPQNTNSRMPAKLDWDCREHEDAGDAEPAVPATAGGER